MEVLVRYFATLRERRGLAEERVGLPPGTTVSALYAQLFPTEADGGLRVAYAVNQVYAEPGRVLQAEDEVAFIPPLGGG